MALDQKDARPLHMQVADDLRQRVVSGEFTVGMKLPSLRALADEYEVSEVTAHTAIRTLQQGGVLESTSGRGTFVKEIPQHAILGVPGYQAQINQLRSQVRDLAERVMTLEEHVR